MPAPPPARSGNPLALIMLGVVALAGIAVGALAAGGVFSKAPSSVTTSRVVTAASARAPSTATSTSVPASTQPSATNAGAANVLQGTTSCGGDLSVGPGTSCSFAQNVEQAYDVTSGGPQTVTAFSPATGITYTINCTGGTPHVCSGGTTRNASLYFTSGPTGANTASGGPAPIAIPPGTSTSGTHGCGGSVTGNGVTSCPFAQNVFQAYARAYQSNGEEPAGSVTAYSPVTNETYVMSCGTNGVTVDCTGAKGALVSFLLGAAADY
jgi:hypothetical protein